MRWIDTLEAAAAEKLPEAVHRYFRQGAAGGISAGEATAAWSAYRFRPRVLNDVSRIDLSTTVLGTPVDAPILVAPSTMQRMVDPDGEIAMARGVGAANSVLGVSSNAGTTFAEFGATGVPWWLQLYVVRNREMTERMLDAAVEGGAGAIVLTVDTPVVGRKEDEGETVWDLVRPGQLLANLPAGEWSDDDLAKAGEPQDPAAATEAPLFTEEEMLLDLTEPSAVVRRKAAALNVTSPQAKVHLGGSTYVITRTDVVPAGAVGTSESGAVLEEHEDGWTVQTADLPLRLTR